jgi:hypothetical protein
VTHIYNLSYFRDRVGKIVFQGPSAKKKKETLSFKEQARHDGCNPSYMEVQSQLQAKAQDPI